jgi:hypothetical protein
MNAQPLCGHERFGMRGSDGSGQRGAEKNRRTEASDGSGGTKSEKCFHGVQSLLGSRFLRRQITLEIEYFSL